MKKLVRLRLHALSHMLHELSREHFNFDKGRALTNLQDPATCSKNLAIITTTDDHPEAFWSLRFFRLLPLTC